VPYRILEDIATADVAFEAWGETLEETFVSAAEAVTHLTVENPEEVLPRERRSIALSSDSEEMLLFDLLQELIFHKDAEELLLRVPAVEMGRRGGTVTLSAEGVGERIDRERHRLYMDIKAVTLHRFRLEDTPEGWRATVVLDV
jgi:SHS2 domain-containing protein